MSPTVASNTDPREGLELLAAGMDRLGVEGLDPLVVARLVREQATRTKAVGAHQTALAGLPATVTPATAQMLQATENRVRAIEAEFGLLDATQVAALLGSRGTPRAFTSDLRASGRIIYLRRLNRFVYPGFQFNHTEGTIKPVIAPLIDLAMKHGRKVERLPFWLTSTTTYFHGGRPVDHIDEPQELLTTAEQAWGIEW